MHGFHSQDCMASLRFHRAAGACLAMMMVLTLFVAQPARAQTYSVIHTFTNGGDGASPFTGLTMDAAGNLYGTAVGGGTNGHGVIFRMKRQGAGWLLTPIYSFAGGNDGASPQGRVALAADGTVYGTTLYGGSSHCSQSGCGTIFRLQPRATTPRTALVTWNETVLYRFSGGSDGSLPQGDLTFDGSGNIYGTTIAGGDANWGTVYKLTKAGGSWTESVLYSAHEDANGSQPHGGVVFGPAGGLYGVFQFSSGANGTAFQLTPSGSGWAEQTIHTFDFTGDNGIEPIGGMIADRAGNLFGTTLYGGTFPAGGVAYEMSPSGGGWIYKTIHSFQDGDGGPVDKLVMDAAGNLYGTALSAGAFGQGSVYKLTPSGGGWTYTTLYDFCPGGFPCSDGAEPMSNVVMDANGNLYGTTSRGGLNDNGVVWQITP